MSSNSRNYKIFCLRSEGFSIGSIAEQMSIDELEVEAVLEMKPELNRKPKSSKVHTLTIADRKKGGAISQEKRTRQRIQNFERIKVMVDIEYKSVELASLIFMLEKSRHKKWEDDDYKRIKEFSMIVKNEDVGLVFLRALQDISVPKSSIKFYWCKSYPNYFGVNKVKNNWGRLDGFIDFKKGGSKEEMLLKVEAFACGTSAVSSRALAQAFFLAGRKVLSHEAG